MTREIITELDIPEDAVLDISETISGMARSAWIRQGCLRMHQQQVQQGLQQAMFNTNFGQVSEQSQMQQQRNHQQQQGIIMDGFWLLPIGCIDSTTSAETTATCDATV